MVWSKDNVGFVEGFFGFGFVRGDVVSGNFELLVLRGLASEGVRIACINFGPIFLPLV